MRIFPSSSQTNVSAVSALRETPRSGRSAHAPVQQSVALSDAALKLSALEDSTQAVDLQKVQTLREAIAQGQLPMDAGKIADGLIASARELLE